MTAPLVSQALQDVSLAVWRHLASLPACRAVLGPTGVDSADTVWMFRNELAAVVEGTSRVAAVVHVDGGWARPNSHNTAQFPRISLELLGDPLRDAGRIVRRDAVDRVWTAWSVFNAEMHRTAGFSEVWGATDSDDGLRVWGSQLMSHPDVYEVPDWDGGARLLVRYGLNVG